MTDHLDKENRLEDEDLDQVAGGQKVTDSEWLALIPEKCPLGCKNPNLKMFHSIIQFNPSNSYILIKCEYCQRMISIEEAD